MEISKLFEILASYLDFAIDFLLLHGLDKRARLGAIDPQLVQFFVAGILMAYLIASIKRMPGYEAMIPSGRLPTTPPEVAASESGEPPATNRSSLASASDMAGFMLVSVLSFLFFHGFLLLYHRVVATTSIGNAKDTLNALFAVYAVYNPVNAVWRQLQRVGSTMLRRYPAIKTVGQIVLHGVNLGQAVALLYYSVCALAAVHGTGRGYMLTASGVLILFIFVIVGGVIFFRWVWRPKAHGRSTV
jgi:hypothetical protein